MVAMIKIARVDWLDAEAEEAMLRITDGVMHCHAYAQPFHGREGDTLSEPLFALSVRNLKHVNDSVSYQRDDSPLGCIVTAEVCDIQQRLVGVGAVRLQLDVPLPGDVSVGEMVRFSCACLISWRDRVGQIHITPNAENDTVVTLVRGDRDE